MAQAYVSGLIDTQEFPPDEVVFGRSPNMLTVRSKLELAAETTVPVLVQGESGTGKEILCRLLHIRTRGPFSPFIRVMCPSIPSLLMDSVVFGYEKGAFTGADSARRGHVELAQGGTLFLDEIGDLDLSVQAKLLRFLQDRSFMRVGGRQIRTVDVRIVSSAKIDLHAGTRDGMFRSDLLYRLNAVTIELPPLRKRLEDLPLLVDYFLDMYSRSFGRSPGPLSARMMCLMRRFDWPGNIRQLENLIRSYTIIGDEEAFTAELAPEVKDDPIASVDLGKPVPLKQITKAATARLEREIIHRVMEANGGSRRKTAEWLNISYRSLLNKLGESDTFEYPAES
jgi:two-component system, NtrC family, response regulator AtoC